jgi:hypothetical protein
MGFFSALSGAANEANEAAHGDRLKNGPASTLSCMGALDDKVRAVAVMKFLDKTREGMKANPWR